jgi:hypothetical protein
MPMAVDDVAVANVPTKGVWRIGRASGPLQARIPLVRDLRGKFSGHRYDVPNVETLYFSTDLEGCYTEVLADLRPDPVLAALVQEEWTAAHRFRPGCISAGWRLRRTAVRIKLDPGYQFLDVESPQTLDYLRVRLAPGIAALGYKELDLGLVHGPDRRVTRLIAAWAESEEAPDDAGLRFAGIRYTSRLDGSRVCWAVWPEGLVISDDKAFPIEREQAELRAVAERYDLRIF